MYTQSSNDTSIIDARTLAFWTSKDQDDSGQASLTVYWTGIPPAAPIALSPTKAATTFSRALFSYGCLSISGTNATLLWIGFITS
ncbi:hypothetical protein Hypma_004383 [Hypsizygus marmoreus]|uniref:Uncharacterized protein n=1 Tax=Hypsizygus marmoreus TaxID=39966 RepID=A0A369K5W6_HYPMA|nr:hypothetical protein Hypma_004383 [Hypsizygus marmoreus]